MATTFIQFNHNSEIGQRIIRGLQQIRDGRQVLRNLLLQEPTMIDGDASSASQFQLVVDQGGFGSLAMAKASWDEINSLVAKLNTPGGQTAADVGPAIDQACAKHGL